MKEFKSITEAACDIVVGLDEIDREFLSNKYKTAKDFAFAFAKKINRDYSQDEIFRNKLILIELNSLGLWGHAEDILSLLLQAVYAIVNNKSVSKSIKEEAENLVKKWQQFGVNPITGEYNI